MTPMSTTETTTLSQKLGRARRASKNARGVTLVEVLIVVAILSLIAGGVAIFAIPRFQQAQKDTAKNDCRALQAAVETWKINKPGASSECPTPDTLKNDKVLKADQNTNDPWGKPYQIRCTGDDFGVMSFGPDGKEGSEDDIWVGTKPSK
jgi:general secretion pathway protein G